MIVRSGFVTFEFQQALELPKPLVFSSADEALKWLKQIASRQAAVIHQLRSYAGSFSGGPDFSRLTDDQALQRLSLLLYSRRVVVIAREQCARAGSPTPQSGAAGPAFPLSQRSTRAAETPSTQTAPSDDPPTFDPNVMAATQAAALVAAASQGMAFCPE